MLKWNCPSCGKENNEDSVSVLDDGSYCFDCIHCLCVFSGYMDKFEPSDACPFQTDEKGHPIITIEVKNGNH